MILISSCATKLNISHSSFCEFISSYRNVAFTFSNQSRYGVKTEIIMTFHYNIAWSSFENFHQNSRNRKMKRFFKRAIIFYRLTVQQDRDAYRAYLVLYNIRRCYPANFTKDCIIQTEFTVIQPGRLSQHLMSSCLCIYGCRDKISLLFDCYFFQYCATKLLL